ncbi:hypothetical protein N9M73_04960 [Rhodobacteraceae bacterium]|nr:hypothetical protein [Paracoccaceae bacterium]
MIFKIVVLFLAGMAVLAMLGRLRMPKVGRRKTVRCPECGRIMIGKPPCVCGAK